MKTNEKNKFIKIAIIIGVFILLIMGFLLGISLRRTQQLEKQNKSLQKREVKVKKETSKDQSDKSDNLEKGEKEESETNEDKDKGSVSQNYVKYHNSRYMYSIEYPDNFVRNPESDNGDGRSFYSNDGKAKLLVYGSNNVCNFDTNGFYNWTITNENYTPEFKNISDDECVISWKDKDLIYYQCSRVGKGSIDTFIISYPESYKDKYSKVVEWIYNSFETPALNDCH